MRMVLDLFHDGNTTDFSTTNNLLILGLFNDGSMPLTCDNNGIKVVDNDGNEYSLTLGCVCSLQSHFGTQHNLLGTQHNLVCIVWLPTLKIRADILLKP